MNSFLERLTLVIHWIAYLITVIAGVFVVYGIIRVYETWAEVFVYLGVALTPNTIGWLIKYILTGNSDYFPFKLED